MANPTHRKNNQYVSQAIRSMYMLNYPKNYGNLKRF